MLYPTTKVEQADTGVLVVRMTQATKQVCNDWKI
jgi:hypothetical protein